MSSDHRGWATTRHVDHETALKSAGYVPMRNLTKGGPATACPECGGIMKATGAAL